MGGPPYKGVMLAMGNPSGSVSTLDTATTWDRKSIESEFDSLPEKWRNAPHKGVGIQMASASGCVSIVDTATLDPRN